MRKICITVFSLLFTAIVSAQEKLPNPKIGKKEIEVSLFNLQDNKRGIAPVDRRDAIGGQFVYRVSGKKNTKIGIGALIAADYNNYYNLRSDVFAYGAAFADITQFIGKRQKWNIGSQAGHGIYNREYKYDGPTAKGFNKYTGRMYYTFSVGYRAVVSKNILISISPFAGFRNFCRKTLTEYYSPPSVQRTKRLEYHNGLGLRLGIVF